MYSNKISNLLFYGLDNNKHNSILKQMKFKNKNDNEVIDNKVIFVLDYLYENMNRKGISMFSIDNMIVTYGFEPRTGKNNTIDRFTNIILKLDDLKIIKLPNRDLKSKQLYTCTFEVDLSGNFFMLSDEEKNRILKQKTYKVNNLDLLTYYSYLKARMYKRSGDIPIYQNGGKAEECHPTFEQIEREAFVNQGIIKKYNDILVEMNLIRYDNPGLFYYISDPNKRIYESANTYVLFKDGWKDELKEGIKIYKNLSDDKVFVENYKNNDKQINGYIGRIKFLESVGKASEEQIEIMNDFIELQTSKNDESKIKFSIKSLLEAEKYKDMLLSSIYEYQNKTELCNKYIDIENKLGLVSNDELIVDKKYYDWIMMNYEEFGYEKAFNYVNKYKRDNGIVLEFDIDDWDFDSEIEECIEAFN